MIRAPKLGITKSRRRVEIGDGFFTAGKWYATRALISSHLLEKKLAVPGQFRANAYPCGRD
jgi:hypothetical protein